jgi:small subunit ribosomal protein S8
MVGDPIGDMLIQIKNARLGGIRTVNIPYSRVKYDLAGILRKEGCLESVEKVGEPPKIMLRITLGFRGKIPVITDLKRRSKPGLRVYVGRRSIPLVLGGMGIAVLSTSAGLMTGKEAKKRGLGGELLCEIW